MKIYLLVLLLLITAAYGSAQGTRRATDTPTKFAARVARAFEDKNLGSLQAASQRNSVKITYEHSLGEDDADRLKSRLFGTLKSAESWIRSQTGRDASFESGRLRRCRGTRCDFVQDGMLHNHLYLVNFTYGLSGGKYYLKAIRFIDGD